MAQKGPIFAYSPYQVVYPNPAENVSGPLAPRLRRAHPPVLRPRPLFSPRVPAAAPIAARPAAAPLPAQQPGPLLHRSAAVATGAPEPVAPLGAPPRARAIPSPAPVCPAAPPGPPRGQWEAAGQRAPGANWQGATRSGGSPGPAPGAGPTRLRPDPTWRGAAAAPPRAAAGADGAAPHRRGCAARRRGPSRALPPRAGRIRRGASPPRSAGAAWV